MRPGQQNKRGRGRGNNNGGSGNSGNSNFNRKGGNPLSRTYDSSGPDVKIRGTAQHIAEKYSQLARDAHSSGDRVMAENYLQHAEHYNRMIAAAQAQMQDRFQRDERGEYQDRDGNSFDQDDMDGGDNDDFGYSTQPGPEENHQPQQRREHNQQSGNQQSGNQQPQDSQPQDRQSQDRQPQDRQSQDRQPQDRQSQDRQPQDRQERQPRENRRDQPRRERRPDRPAAQPGEPVAATNAPVAATAPTAPQPDGLGPQPVIEGVPAEVAVEQETQGEAAPRRRRTAATRPRRPRRGEGSDEGEGGSDDAKPALEDVSAGE